MKNRSCLMLAILGVLSLGIAACGGGNSTGQAASVSSAAETVKAENDSVDEPAAETDGKGSAKESADAEVSAPAASGDDTSDSGSAEAELWDSDEEFTYDYGEDAVLYNANGVRIRARRLIYKSTDKGMKLSVNANIQNNTDGIIQTKGDWVSDTDNSAGGSKSDPQSGGNFGLLSVKNWNCMLGETEDCFLGTYQLEIRNETGLVDVVQCDMYSSKKTPFANIMTGVESLAENDPNAEENADSADDGPAAASLEKSADKKKEQAYFRLILATSFSESSNIGQAVQKYLDNIAEVTDGHVVVDAYYSGTLFARDEIEHSLSLGAADMGTYYTVQGYSDYALTNIVMLPFQGFGDGVKSTRLLWELYDTVPEMAEEWEGENKLLGLFALPPVMFEGIAPMHLMNAGYLTRTIHETGGFSQEVFEAAGLGACALLISQKAWSRLPQEYQFQIESISGRGQSLKFAAARAEDLPEEGDDDTVMPDAETIAEWKALSDGCAEEWADLITEKKGIDGKAYLAKAKELISGY